MVNYSVKLYAKAARDLDGIYAYIMNELLAPDAADNLIKDIEKAILSLENTPERGSQRKTGTYAFPIKKEVHIVTVRYVHSQF